MYLINISRRAKLGRKVKINYELAIDKLIIAKKYNNKVYKLLEKDKEHTQFHLANYLIGLLSVLEAYISDTLFEFIVCYPGQGNEKNIKFNDIAKAGSLSEWAKIAAGRKINELSYKKFIEYHDCFSSIMGLTNDVDIILLDKITELKATRDIFVHANGKCNEIYLKKSGALARGREGEELPLTSDYINYAERTVEEYLSSVYQEIPEKIKTAGKVKAFREMWEACEISKGNNFDDFWDYDLSEDMVRPKNSGFEYGWSGSEQAAFDFFLGIYSSQHPERKTDLMNTMMKWSPNTNIGKVIISWMESPFSF